MTFELKNIIIYLDIYRNTISEVINLGMSETLKAISDPVRREILELLKDGRKTAGEISNSFNLTGATVSYHLSNLKKANLIKSVRGAQGGYLLSRKASEITVYDILTVLEGPVSISDCLLDKDSCQNSDSCVTKLVWEKMRDAMDNVMKSITLCDMVNNYNETHNINRLENDIYCLMNNEIKK